MSVYRPNTDELAREQRLLNDPSWQAEREQLYDLATRLSVASTGDDFFALHASLVARLRARQGYSGDLRARVQQLVERRRELAATQPKPLGELRAVQSELTAVEWASVVQRRLHWLLLDLGDALVWRSLGFDRSAITVLGQGNRVAWLSDGLGWEAEVAAVDELSRQGTFAILNDATTCLRLGDITCFFEDRIEILEIKAGRIVQDDHPQEIRLREAVTLINEHHGVVDGQQSAIVRCPTPLETYLDQLSPILRRARTKGRDVTCLSSSQLVVAHDLGHGVAARFDEAEVRAAARWPDADIVLNWGTSLRRMRDRHHKFAYLAPLALLPLSIEDKVDLLLGQLDFTVWINASSVARVLQGRGLLAQPFGPPESERWFMQAGRVRGSTLTTVHIAAHLREQMALELVTPTYVAKLADTLLTAVENSTVLADQQTMVVPGEESGVWLA